MFPHPLNLWPAKPLEFSGFLSFTTEFPDHLHCLERLGQPSEMLEKPLGKNPGES